MQAIFHFGHKILFDGHVMICNLSKNMVLIINVILFDGYLMGNRFSIFKDMNIKYFLFDGYLIELNKI